MGCKKSQNKERTTHPWQWVSWFKQRNERWWKKCPWVALGTPKIACPSSSLCLPPSCLKKKDETHFKWAAVAAAEWGARSCAATGLEQHAMASRSRTCEEKARSCAKTLEVQVCCVEMAHLRRVGSHLRDVPLLLPLFFLTCSILLNPLASSSSSLLLLNLPSSCYQVFKPSPWSLFSSFPQLF